MRGAAGVALLPSARLPPTRGTVNSLFDEEIRGHHSMRDHVLTLVTDADLAYRLPGANPSLGELLVEMGDLQGVYTHSFATFTLD